MVQWHQADAEWPPCECYPRLTSRLTSRLRVNGAQCIDLAPAGLRQCSIGKTHFKVHNSHRRPNLVEQNKQKRNGFRVHLLTQINKFRLVESGIARDRMPAAVHFAHCAMNTVPNIRRKSIKNFLFRLGGLLPVDHRGVGPPHSFHRRSNGSFEHCGHFCGYYERPFHAAAAVIP